MTRQRGFTLIELAIVLVIVTILIGGLAVPLTAQIQARRIAETRQILDEAREAIVGYAMTHAATLAERRHLPCPDTDNPPDGRENRTGDACTQASGLLPWVDLGTASQDAWGNRLRCYEPDAARLVRAHLQMPGLFQTPDVLVRRARLPEAERIGDLLQRRRQALGVGVILDEGEDLRLASGEVGHQYGPGRGKNLFTFTAAGKPGLWPI